MSSSLIKAAKLSGRSIIEISGPDAQKFLKGQTCKDVEMMGGGYSGFLTPSGRVNHTVFIHPVSPDRYLVSYHASHPHPLTKLLPPYRLRNKVRFVPVTNEWDVYATWGHPYGKPSPVTSSSSPSATASASALASSSSSPPTSTSSSSPESPSPTSHPDQDSTHQRPWPSWTWKAGSGGAAERSWFWPGGMADLGEMVDSDEKVGLGWIKRTPGKQQDGGMSDEDLKRRGVGCWDLRGGDRGWGRMILPKGSKPKAELVSVEEYTLRRMVSGLPEGPEELIPEQALPLESCMDIQGGVDFRKGCYVGQELTVRTYHTGATRKRILPLLFFPLSDPSLPLHSITPPTLDPTHRLGTASNLLFHPDPASGGTTRPKSAGKVLSQIGNVGLGLVRLEMADRSWWGRAIDDNMIHLPEDVGFARIQNPGGAEQGEKSNKDMTVGEWVKGARMTVDIGGETYGVKVGLGEAYAQALREAFKVEDR